MEELLKQLLEEVNQIKEEIKGIKIEDQKKPEEENSASEENVGENESISSIIEGMDSVKSDLASIKQDGGALKKDMAVIKQCTSAILHDTSASKDLETEYRNRIFNIEENILRAEAKIDTLYSSIAALNEFKAYVNNKLEFLTSSQGRVLQLIDEIKSEQQQVKEDSTNCVNAQLVRIK